MDRVWPNVVRSFVIGLLLDSIGLLVAFNYYTVGSRRELVAKLCLHRLRRRHKTVSSRRRRWCVLGVRRHCAAVYTLLSMIRFNIFSYFSAFHFYCFGKSYGLFVLCFKCCFGVISTHCAEWTRQRLTVVDGVCRIVLPQLNNSNPETTVTDANKLVRRRP